MILLWTLMGIIGVYYVAIDNSFNANVIWSISNIGMIIYNYNLAEYEMSLMFLIYWMLAVYGVYRGVKHV